VSILIVYCPQNLVRGQFGCYNQLNMTDKQHILDEYHDQVQWHLSQITQPIKLHVDDKSTEQNVAKSIAISDPPYGCIFLGKEQRYMATGHSTSGVVIWDTYTFKQIRKFGSELFHYVKRMASIGDRFIICANEATTTVGCYDWTSGQMISTMKAGGYRVTLLPFGDGYSLVGSDNGSLMMFDVLKGENLAECTCPSLRCMTYCDPYSIFTGHGDGRVCIYDIRTFEKKDSFYVTGNPSIADLQLLDENTVYVVAHALVGHASIWNFKTKTKLFQFHLATHYTQALNSQIIASHHNEFLYVWNYKTRTIYAKIQGPPRDAVSTAVSSQQGLLVIITMLPDTLLIYPLFSVDYFIRALQSRLRSCEAFFDADIY
jgi:WD40 repeat protein